MRRSCACFHEAACCLVLLLWLLRQASTCHRGVGALRGQVCAPKSAWHLRLHFGRGCLLECWRCSSGLGWLLCRDGLLRRTLGPALQHLGGCGIAGLHLQRVMRWLTCHVCLLLQGHRSLRPLLGLAWLLDSRPMLLRLLLLQQSLQRVALHGRLQRLQGSTAHRPTLLLLMLPIHQQGFWHKWCSLQLCSWPRMQRGRLMLLAGSLLLSQQQLLALPLPLCSVPLVACSSWGPLLDVLHRRPCSS